MTTAEIVKGAWYPQGAWPVVKLDTFHEPVKLSWLVAP